MVGQVALRPADPRSARVATDIESSHFSKRGLLAQMAIVDYGVGITTRKLQRDFLHGAKH